MSYEPKIRKFSGQEDSAQWKAEFISEIEGPEGPGERMKDAYFSQCLEGAALEWYCHDLEYRVKVYWDLLSTAFDTRWKPTTSNVHAIEVLQNSEPPNFADIRQQYINYHIAHRYCVAAHAPELPMQTTTATTPAPANTATPAIYETATTATTPAHTDTAAPTAISETAATPVRADRALDVRHVTTVPARSEVELTIITTATSKTGQREKAEPREDRDEKRQRRAEERERRTEE